MDRKRIDQFIITLVTCSCIGLCVENYMLGWEFWVPPLVIIGAVAAWVMHIMGKPAINIREVCYFIYALLAAYYHGIHETSFFDSVAVFALLLVGFSFMNREFMMHFFLAEYILMMFFHVFIGFRNNAEMFDSLNISRIILHIVIVFFIYVCCIRSIHVRSEEEDLAAAKDIALAANNRDTDDFLSNISHELRTPVNVVNGMSSLLIKNGVGEEAVAIKEAGLRLTGQIDDIQDYTEVRRGDIFVEEENYTPTSLINDVITNFRMNRENKNLEMVVDLSADVPSMMRGDVKKLHKIFRHLLSNAIKFTKEGGVYVRMFTEKKDYGVNLCIGVFDTGSGMSRKDIRFAPTGLYQTNKKRNRSSGGVGLGLSIVYGFAHSMGGFVKITSGKGEGTAVKVTIPQEIVDPEPCLKLTVPIEGDVLFHVRSDKYKVPRLREFYRRMAANLASDIHVPLYPAESLKEVERLMEKLNVKYIYMGQEEYEANSEYFDKLSMGDIVVAVSANDGFKPNRGSRVIAMPKPLYAYPVIKVFNEGRDAKNIDSIDYIERPDLTGVKALVVDDEPMNLVVAAGIFKEYGIITDSAESGAQAIDKYKKEDYDIVFMDHMMPEMDGVEAMKRIKREASDRGKKAVIVALTANVVSGAREMFIREGFDGFIGKPINTNEFERVMTRLLPSIKAGKGGEGE